MEWRTGRPSPPLLASLFHFSSDGRLEKKGEIPEKSCSIKDRGCVTSPSFNLSLVTFQDTGGSSIWDQGALIGRRGRRAMSINLWDIDRGSVSYSNTCFTRPIWPKIIARGHVLPENIMGRHAVVYVTTARRNSVFLPACRKLKRFTSRGEQAHAGTSSTVKQRRGRPEENALLDGFCLQLCPAFELPLCPDVSGYYLSACVGHSAPLTSRPPPNGQKCEDRRRDGREIV